MPVRPVALLLTGMTLAGCAGITTLDGERLGAASPEFRAYVERVFREQNRVLDALAFADEDEPNRGPALAAAEAALLEACAPVNELATARRDDRALGARRSLAAARTVPDCEAAARAAESALRSADR